jgi:hypothetical protein
MQNDAAGPRSAALPGHRDINSNNAGRFVDGESQ